MARPWDLRDMSSGRNINDFLDSFDVIFADCDGVLWQFDGKIEGALEALARLQKIGKMVYFVSNNSTLTDERYIEKFRKCGFHVTKDQIVIPSKAIAWQLNKIGFKDEAFLIGTTALQQVLKDAGIKVVMHETQEVQNMTEALSNIKDRPSIRAVICDFDYEYSWVKVMRAIRYLKRDNTLYLTGATNSIIHMSDNVAVLGPGPFHDIIAKHSGREPTPCAKPSNILKNYLLEKCKGFAPERSIFLGDTIAHDMEFAALCGFKKFMVESGLDRLEDALLKEKTTPDFYLPSLGHLLPMLNDITPNGIA